jgi:two-component sensor histidine kinase
MLKYILPFTLVFLSLNKILFAIDIDENSSNLSLLDKSSIFIDSSQTLTLQDIKQKKFTEHKSIDINLGYQANKTLWIQFTLHNKSNKSIIKTLEFENEETEHIILYQANEVLRGGFFYYDENRRSLTPSFLISLKSNESKIYYIQTLAQIKPLKANITLWNEIDFVKYDMKDRIYRFMFVGIIFVLLLYNLMILVFTRDKAYLYYSFYLFALIFYSNYYSGMLSFYLLSSEGAIWAIKIHTVASVFFVFFCLLFTKEFLQTKQFKNLNKIINITMYTLPFIAIFSYDNLVFNSHSVTSLLLIGLLLVYSGFYALYKGVEEAKYYVIGWTVMLISLTLFGFQAFGIYNLKEYSLTYLPEIAFVLETLLFSMALAHRIKLNNEEKLTLNAKLIAFQESEKADLNRLVEEKTNDLKFLLNEKEILYKELNHRVKNNFMMILSLLKLQISRIKISETKNALKITENRIKSIANLYEMLVLDTQEININTQEYLENIYHNISLNFDKEVEIHYEIDYNIALNSLIYIGLVFNELVTNSFKYAFLTKKGKIFVTVKKVKKIIYLSIIDNGIGFTRGRKNTLGLIIVETLIEGQLEGKLSINASLGTEVNISWKA